MSGRNYDGAIIDLDGTVYLSETLLDGVKEGIERLQKDGIEILFLTNNPVQRRVSYYNRLQSFGIDVDRENVINSAKIAAEYLATHHPGESTFVMGEQPLVMELQRANVDVTSDPSSASVVLASMDRSFEYDDLHDILVAFESDPAFYATNPDRTCPTDNGLIPDAAAMIGAIEGVTGRELDAVLGKPSEIAVEVSVNQLGTTPENCLIVGDRLETDMKMGWQTGMTTALVLSGVSDRVDVESSPNQPDYVLDSLREIDTCLQS